MKEKPTLIAFGILTLVILAVAMAGCDTIRHDPMPKWHGYELRFDP